MGEEAKFRAFLNEDLCCITAYYLDAVYFALQTIALTRTRKHGGYCGCTATDFELYRHPHLEDYFLKTDTTTNVFGASPKRRTGGIVITVSTLLAFSYGLQMYAGCTCLFEARLPSLVSVILKSG